LLGHIVEVTLKLGLLEVCPDCQLLPTHITLFCEKNVACGTVSLHPKQYTLSCLILLFKLSTVLITYTINTFTLTCVSLD
jgi:hypothetical protein